MSLLVAGLLGEEKDLETLLYACNPHSSELNPTNSDSYNINKIDQLVKFSFSDEVSTIKHEQFVLR